MGPFTMHASLGQGRRLNTDSPINPVLDRNSQGRVPLVVE